MADSPLRHTNWLVHLSCCKTCCYLLSQVIVSISFPHSGSEQKILRLKGWSAFNTWHSSPGVNGAAQPFPMTCGRGHCSGMGWKRYSSTRTTNPALTGIFVCMHFRRWMEKCSSHTFVPSIYSSPTSPPFTSLWCLFYSWPPSSLPSSVYKLSLTLCWCFLEATELHRQVVRLQTQYSTNPPRI